MMKFYTNIQFKKAFQKLKNEMEDEENYLEMKRYRRFTLIDVLFHFIYDIFKWTIILFITYSFLLAYGEVWTKETLPQLCNYITK